ncbi:S9 family peptidase [candidate division KSB1 bacterium]|nr:S9 family peptidase [candidate division KSB1 bacterium]MBL7092344.1 S9 family peptidase [candidate division KSB1 bacterium]
MKIKHTKLEISIGIIIILMLSFTLLISGEKQEKEIPLDQWLKLGPVQTPLPVFHDVKNMKGKTFDFKNLLQFDQIKIDELYPEPGAIIKWNKFSKLIWDDVNADTAGLVHLSSSQSDSPEIYYLATYINVNRWTKAQLKISSYHLMHIYLDGKKIKSKTSSEKPKTDTTEVQPGKITHDLKLETGKHLLVIKTLRDPKNSSQWTIKAKIELTEKWRTDDLVVTTSPKQIMNISHLLDGPKIRSVSISPDGEFVTLTKRKTLPPKDESESWIELWRLKNKTLVQTFRGGMKIGSIQWSPVGRKFSFTSSNNGKTTLWIMDLKAGTTMALLENIEHLGGHIWAPDASFIIYSINEKPEADKTKLKRFQGMPDRLPGWRNRSFLYLVNYPEGTQKRLTGGNLTTRLQCFSPDGKKILFSRSIVDFNERPYSKTQLFTLNLSTMELDSIWTGKWAGDVQWSPNGKKLLMTGGPSMFGDVGKNVLHGIIPNNYDNQAYLYDLAAKKVESITRNFNPSIGQANWSKTENCIYFNTTDRSYRNLYRYDLKKKKFEQINTGVEVLNSIDIADNKKIAVYTGSSANVPTKAYILDFKKKTFRLLFDPGKDDFKDVSFGKVERWTFNNARDIEIEGRIYYPPGFDYTKKYPCIVYYYGGTSPVTRNFGGRYPKNLYAAQGYVVYVLQPSGAIGFGQEFSALHVNDWGIIVADEIIDGTTKFLAALPFIDQERVGCIGASYGGFMTMLLQTRTTIFSAAIAHAGISMIPSYWGEGYWGYLYSAVAAANSFPWNRKDIYVNQSPLFHADKIETPLLLLHGGDDTNVPPGESIQLYTALKLLGKEVELIQVEGQNHHIMAYNRRTRWTKTILAWFDKWLKDQPQWWEDLYPPNLDEQE